MRALLAILCAFTLLLSCKEDRYKWIEQSVPEGNFSVFMPSPIEKTKKTEITAFGKQTRYFVRWKPGSMAIDKFKLFEVSYTDCPPSVLADSSMIAFMLDSAVEMRKRDFSEVEPIESQDIELNGYLGRAFFFDDPKGNTLVSVKICIAGTKLYDLVVISKKNYATQDDAGNFFNSFKVL